MRILLTVRNFDFGGAENHVRELANALAARAHDVSVISPGGRQTELLDPAVRHIPVRFSDLRHPLQAMWMARFIQRERIDVVHAHQRLATLTSLLAGRIASRPVVVTLHGQLQHDLTNWPGAAAMLTRLIVVSPFFADLVARHNPPLAAKTVCIPNGVRSPLKPVARDAGRFRVAFASRMTLRMEPLFAALISAALDVALQFPDFVLHIYGDGPVHSALSAYADATNRAAGRRVVTLEGYHADLPATIASCALTLGVGRVALESLAQGVPLVPLNRHYLGAPVTRERFAALAAMNFVPQHSPAPTRPTIAVSLCAALAELNGLAHEARCLQARVAGDFGVNVMAERVEELYADAVAQQTAARPRAHAGGRADASVSAAR